MGEFSLRKLIRIKSKTGKSSTEWKKIKPLIIVLKNFLISKIGNMMPSNFNYIFFKLMGVKIEKNVQLMPSPGFDFFFPELISVGEGTIIGMDCLILCHEFTTNEFKYGGVKIGRNVLIGARSVVLAGVTIGDNSIIPANTLVYTNIPSNMIAFGSPLQFKKIENKR